MPKLYQDKVVDIAVARKEVEKFINSREEQSDPNFLSFIEQKLNALKNTTLKLTKIDTHLSELCDHIDNILVYIQAIVEADKNSVSSVILRELKDEGMFIKLLRETTEDYAAVNKKVNYLSQIVNDLKSQEVKSKEEVIRHVESIYKYIELIKKDSIDYGDLLYGRLYQKIEEVRKDNTNSVERLQQKYDEIIEIIQSEKNNIEKDMKAFEPLVKDIIHTELDEKGTFIELLTNKIIQISNEKEGELQEKFKKIVEHIVGKGTETNPKIARENTIRGFKSLKDSDIRENITRELNSLSETDVDEILGSKILKIVDGKSKIGGALAGFGDAFAKLRNQIAFGGRGDDAKKFFDGLSFSVYYYNVIPQEGRTYSLPENLLPKELRESDLNYISKFKTIIEKLESDFKKYNNNNIKRNIPEIIDNGEPLDIYCFVRIVDSKRAYFILSHEPSNFFKDQLDSILLKRYKNKDDMQKNLEELSKNYTIPKVDIAVFNSNGFDLPSDDGKSVVSSKGGEKYLNHENEEELLILLDDIKNFFDKKQSLFKKNKDYSKNRDVWYYWATSKKKYLAVKMREVLSDKDREKFCGYVEKNIWNNLVDTKSLSEMQDWLNTFIQKDAGVLADKPGIFSKGRQIVNGLTLVSTLLVLAIAVVYFWNTTLLFPDLRFEIKDTKIQNENEFSRLNSKFDLTLKIFREELRSTSKKAATKMELSAELSNDCAEPFIFSFHITMIDKLSEEDRTRLKRIAKNLIVLQNECKVSIILYNNDNNNWNLERAKNIRTFLIDEGVPETSVVISNAMEKQTLSGVRLKLMML